MIRYVFKDRPLTIKGADKADEKMAQKIGEAIARITQDAEGRCNSKTILDAARNRKNYLHRFFEWRDSIAAEKYRQEQARELVACIDVVDEREKNPRPRPAFISIVERNGRGYRTAEEVLSSSRLQSLVLEQIEREMEAMEKRLMQYADICHQIRKAREMIAERRARYAAHAHPEHA